MWLNHHHVFGLIGRADRVFLSLNTLLLLCVAFVPFPTAVLADFVREGEAREIAAFFYAGTFAVTAVVYNAVWRYAATGRRLILKSVPDRDVDAVSQTFLVGPFVYCVAAGLAFASAWTTVTLCGVLAVGYTLPATGLLGLARR